MARSASTFDFAVDRSIFINAALSRATHEFKSNPFYDAAKNSDNVDVVLRAVQHVTEKATEDLIAKLSNNSDRPVIDVSYEESAKERKKADICTSLAAFALTGVFGAVAAMSVSEIASSLSLGGMFISVSLGGFKAGNAIVEHDTDKEFSDRVQSISEEAQAFSDRDRTKDTEFDMLIFHLADSNKNAPNAHVKMAMESNP